jgi:hypothetical protein
MEPKAGKVWVLMFVWKQHNPYSTLPSLVDNLLTETVPTWKEVIISWVLKGSNRTSPNMSSSSYAMSTKARLT